MLLALSFLREHVRGFVAGFRAVPGALGLGGQLVYAGLPLVQLSLDGLAWRGRPSR